MAELLHPLPPGTWVEYGTRKGPKVGRVEVACRANERYFYDLKDMQDEWAATCADRDVLKVLRPAEGDPREWLLART
ncbi:hypothetical protein GCM10028801_30690 [Nocardioides maradonensis]